jgi:Putative metallopeptidase domain
VAERRIEGLAGARLWAATRFPYLATGVFGAQVIGEPGSGTVSVDESWRMRADPDLVADWTAAQLGSVLVHHVCHLLRTHAERARGAGVGPQEASDWVRAADAEINDDLVPAGLDLPGQPVLPRDLGAADGLLAEQYFEAIRSRRGSQARDARGGPGGDTTDRSGPGARGGPGGETTDRSAEKNTGAAGGWRECGSGADGVPRRGDGPPGMPAWQADLLRRQVAQDVIAYGKLPGSVPAGLLRWAQEILSPKVDWRTLLAAELRRAVAEVAGAVDYSYRRPSRRSAVSGPVVLPALRRPVPEVAVVCDTSGSMSEALLAAGPRAGPAGSRAGLRHRGRARPARHLGPPGAARGRGRDRHGRGHRRGRRAAAQARRDRRADRRVHPVARGGAEGDAGGGGAAGSGRAGRAVVGPRRPGRRGLTRPGP